MDKKFRAAGARVPYHFILEGINAQMADVLPFRGYFALNWSVRSPRFGGEIAVACQDQAVEGSMRKQFRVMLGIEAASHGASRLIENAQNPVVLQARNPWVKINLRSLGKSLELDL